VTKKRRASSAQQAVIDACCLIDVLASGQAEAILRVTGHAWFLPSSVQAEVQYVRQHDPDKPGSYRNVPVDLTPFVTSGVLSLCQPDDAQEQARYIHYAALFRSDGEAMCLALAECRGWIVATDDRRAIQVAHKAGLSIVSCPEMVQAWAYRTGSDATCPIQVLTDIQALAQFRPNPSMPCYPWSVKQRAAIGP
jgi:hypothetical protein